MAQGRSLQSFAKIDLTVKWEWNYQVGLSSIEKKVSIVELEEINAELRVRIDNNWHETLNEMKFQDTSNDKLIISKGSWREF
ncbi:CLUMA_CG004388, isoform A [Clunio marinus]|uniref:CLUMA_CG004388, isoform A n=1 Tax=Clunio marinus TaxID=568069 RepID=A0A1J1HRT7_9DIPT|nr:CLUMA_CG004388, isoform A [Clunio marinus]